MSPNPISAGNPFNAPPTNSRQNSFNVTPQTSGENHFTAHPHNRRQDPVTAGEILNALFEFLMRVEFLINRSMSLNSK